MICLSNKYLLPNSGISKNRFNKNWFKNLRSEILPNKNPKTQLNFNAKSYYDHASKMKNYRQKLNFPMDNIILDFQSKELDNDFLKFCFLNRDNISYVLFHQITALKLKSEENGTDDTRVNKINGLRKKILENIQLIDQPISQSLILSEKTVKEILVLDDINDISNLTIKKDKLNISSLWIVLSAAISAWQKKIKLDVDDEASKLILKKLIKIKKTIFSENFFHSLLAKELSLIDSYFFLNSEKQNIEIGILDGLKLLICVLEKLPKNSYGPLLEEVSDFYNNIVLVKLGVKKQSLFENIIQFSPKKIKTDSRLVNIKNKNLKN